MKEQDKIPTGKVQRAGKFARAGAKVGLNYLRHSIGGNKEERDQENARVLYDVLSNLKGSALKMAQMLSLDQQMLPEAFARQFTMAQYSAPPLSLPLVVKTFKSELGKSPYDLFDSFEANAGFAASMGQVHKAILNGQKLAVKIQYPGVADSIVSDLKVVRPIATRVLGLKQAEVAPYFEEVQSRLLEEADYRLELRRSVEFARYFEDSPGLEFPKYYPNLSSDRIISMSWLKGKHLDQFLNTHPSQELIDQVGQHLWDFFNKQVNDYGLLHADPHPGNFLFREDGTVGVIDFGCLKKLESDFRDRFFELLNPVLLQDETKLVNQMELLELLHPNDAAGEREMFVKVMKESIELLAKPFSVTHFDFGDKEYMSSLFSYGEQMSKDRQLRKANKARGPKDALFINRAFFGLYTLLHRLGARVKTNWDFNSIQ